MEERTKKNLLAVKVGIAGNVVLAIFKILLGVLGNSIALISDGIDTIMDVAKSILVFQGIKVAALPPDTEHPYGHGRAETIVANIIGVSVIFAGFLIGQESIMSFGHKDVIASLMIIGASVSIIGKFALSFYMFSVGKKFSNQALIANAKDYMSDVFASLAVLIGGLLVLFTGMTIFDPIASLVVAALIAYMGIDIMKSGIPELMEKQEDPEFVKGVEQISNSIRFASNPHLIRVRKLGSYYIVDMHIELPGNMNLENVHNIVTTIEHDVKTRFPQIKEVMIHAEPKGEGADEWPDLK